MVHEGTKVVFPEEGSGRRELWGKGSLDSIRGVCKFSVASLETVCCVLGQGRYEAYGEHRRKRGSRSVLLMRI